MSTREPTETDLVAYICQVQPELDEKAARRILSLDPSVGEWIAIYWAQQRTIADSLLGLHLEFEGTPA